MNGRYTLKMKPVLSAPYKISYITYGNSNPSHHIFCCHGLTGNAMDFDPLSNYLCMNDKTNLSMTSIDLSGRGHSDYLSNYNMYKIGNHLTECDDLINHLRLSYSAKNTPITTWVGTAFGGILGMHYAAFYYPTIDHLILNDIGPFIPSKDINEMREFSMNNPLTKTLEESKSILKHKYAQEYGPSITELDWDRMAKDGTYHDEQNNGYRLSYDPNIVEGVLMDIEMNDDGVYTDWNIFESVWNKIPKEVKILLIRGQKSNILSRDTVDKMLETNENLSVVEIENIGHHPLLADKEQMDIIAEFIGL